MHSNIAILKVIADFIKLGCEFDLDRLAVLAHAWMASWLSQSQTNKWQDGVQLQKVVPEQDAVPSRTVHSHFKHWRYFISSEFSISY